MPKYAGQLSRIANGRWRVGPTGPSGPTLAPSGHQGKGSGH